MYSGGFGLLEVAMWISFKEEEGRVDKGVLKEKREMQFQTRFTTLVGTLLPIAFGFYCLYPSMTPKHGHIDTSHSHSVILKRNKVQSAR
jgi:hypothetical protein